MVPGKLPLVSALDSGAPLAEGAVMMVLLRAVVEGVVRGGGSSLVGKQEGSGRGALDVDVTCDES